MVMMVVLDKNNFNAVCEVFSGITVVKRSSQFETKQYTFLLHLQWKMLQLNTIFTRTSPSSN